MSVRMRTRTPIVRAPPNLWISPDGASPSLWTTARDDRSIGPQRSTSPCATVVRVMDSPDDLDSGADGMGPRHRGPSFVPWSGRTGRALSSDRSPPPRAPTATSRPMRSMLPTVISLLAIALVCRRGRRGQPGRPLRRYPCHFSDLHCRSHDRCRIATISNTRVAPSRWAAPVLLS